MFPVEVNILNPEHLLKPGMNTEVEIHIGQRQGALAVPNTALRRARDVASAASVFGLDPRAVERQLATRETADGRPRSGGGDTTTDGSKLHAAERAPQPPRRDSDSGAGAPRAAGAGADTSYIVFALRGGKIVPIAIRSGLTDQDYMEVTAGLTDRDTVLVPTSAPPR
jgi:HlyD family secretion protein